METQRLRVELDEGTWRTDPPDPSLAPALGHVFGGILRLEEVPRDLPVIGHVHLFGRWCVFVREPETSALDVVLLSPNEYLRHAFDPFLVGARILASPTLKALVDKPGLGHVSAPARPIPVRSVENYLPLAWARYAASPMEERQRLYSSLLPTSVAPDRSSLTCFVAEPEAEGPSAAPEPEQAAAGPEPEQLDEAREPGGTPASEEPPQPTLADPFELGDETLPTPAGLEPPIADTAGERPPEANEVATPRPELAGEWFDVPLARTEAPEQTPADPATAAPDLPTAAAQADEPSPPTRISELERSLARRTAALAVLSVLFLVAAVAAVLYSRAVDRRLADLEATRVRLSTLTDGLGLGNDSRDPEIALRAKLADLATVSVQSGAWQEGLQSRGVEPETFLSELVEISRIQPELKRLAAADAALSDLAKRHDPLVALSDRSEDLTAIADEREALVKLAGVGERLLGLAEAKPRLDTLAASSKDLAALAGRRGAIEDLLAQASTLTSMAREVANLITFMERRQADLERLAEHTAPLLELSSVQRHLVDLARKKTALDALIQVNEQLLTLADSPELARLVKDQDSLKALTDNLGELLELARHSRELLMVVAERYKAPESK